jgi:NADPH:quinone reductase-like Zn-dependent oxidoreductase
MKAVVVHQYGGPEVLQYEEFPDPSAGPGEVLVRVAAASVNPVDLKQRSGMMSDVFPIVFPGVIGVDLSGTVVSLGPGAKGFAIGDQVFGFAEHTYAELCAVKAEKLAKIPHGLDLLEATALPLVTTTGNHLITLGTAVKAGQTVLIAGAAGSVGRAAVYTAKARGAVVIAGVLARQLADAASLGADQTIATDDGNAVQALPPVDAVADTVGGKTAELLIAKVKPGGVFASVVGAPKNAADYPAITVKPVYVEADANTLLFMTTAVRDGKLAIPLGPRMPLKDAARAHALVARGGVGKVLLVVS